MIRKFSENERREFERTKRAKSNFYENIRFKEQPKYIQLLGYNSWVKRTGFFNGAINIYYYTASEGKKIIEFYNRLPKPNTKKPEDDL